MNELRAFSDFDRIMIVGHEPDFSGLVEWLLGCSGSSVEAKKGSLIGIEIFPPACHAVLRFVIPPKMVRKV
jgi:phosphohistidine phosphatase SixA